MTLRSLHAQHPTKHRCMAGHWSTHGQRLTVRATCRLDRHLPTNVDLSDGSAITGSHRAVFASAGGRHSCAMVSHGGRIAVHSTGANDYGQLGHNDTTLRTRCGRSLPPFLSASNWLKHLCLTSLAN